jgi:hypothetical protein
MKRFLLTAVVTCFLTAVVPAQSAPDANRSASPQDVVATIQSELEIHGERMLGQETYRWSTRLEKYDACRVEFSVRVVSNFGDATVRTETVKFSLGAIDPYGIAPKKSRLELPCSNGERCVFSTSTCSKKTKNGITTDCATAIQQRVDTFSLQLDRDDAAASRLELAFRKAANLCREPKSVAF